MMFRYIRKPANTSSHIMLWPTTGTLPICEPLRDASCTVLPLDLLDQLAEVAVLLNGRARAASEKVPPGEILLALSSLTPPVPLGRINAPHAFLPPPPASASVTTTCVPVNPTVLPCPLSPSQSPHYRVGHPPRWSSLG